MPRTQSRTQARRRREERREASDTTWIAITSRAAEILNQQNFADGDAPSLLTIAGIEFDLHNDIVVPIVSLKEVVLFDCGYGRRTKRRARRYDLVTAPATWKLKCNRIYNCYDKKTKTSLRVRIIRRTKFQGLGEKYYKYEVVG